MKIGEAQKIYRGQRAALLEQKKALLKQKEALDKKAGGMTVNAANTAVYANEAGILELSIKAVDEKFEENQKVLDSLAEQYAAVWNVEVSRQQSDAAADYATDMAKIMEVARRIGEGARVPAQDEKKLMDYSMEMYMSAKNLAMLKKLKKKKEYESLWDEEEEGQTEYDPQGKAENAEACVNVPEVSEADVGVIETGGAEGI